MAKKSHVKAFEEFYLNHKLELAEYSLSDALFEFLDANPDCVGLKLDELESASQARSWALTRQVNVKGFSSIVKDEVKRQAKLVTTKIEATLIETFALELVVLDSIFVELYSTIDIKSLSNEDKLKYMQMVLQRRAKMDETHYKRQKDNLPLGTVYRHPQEESVEEEEVVEQKPTDTLPTKGIPMHLELQAAVTVLNHTQASTNPLPSDAVFEKLQKRGDKIKSKRPSGAGEYEDD